MRTHAGLRRTAGLVLFLVVLAMSGHGPVYGQTVKITIPETGPNFKSGPYVDLVRDKCLECHTGDYVMTQPILDRAGWTKVVNKMKDRFGMRALSSSQMSHILDYLVYAYGK